MPKDGNAGFEIPADMLALAEKSVEQAKQAFDVFISAAQHAVSTAENQAASAQAGAKEVGELCDGFRRAEHRLVVRVRAETAAGQRSQRRHGTACGGREQPDRGAHGAGEGTNQSSGKNGGTKTAALTARQPVSSHKPGTAAGAVPYGIFVQCNIFYCNASKTGV